MDPNKQANKQKAQRMKNQAVGRMIGRKPMPTGKVPSPHPTNPASTGEQNTQIRNARSGQRASNGPTRGGYRQQSGPGMLPK